MSAHINVGEMNTTNEVYEALLIDQWATDSYEENPYYVDELQEEELALSPEQELELEIYLDAFNKEHGYIPRHVSKLETMKFSLKRTLQSMMFNLKRKISTLQPSIA